MSYLYFSTPIFFIYFQVPMSCRQMLLLKTLGVNMSFLESIPSHLQLPVAVTCYWICYSEPKVKLHQLKALLLMIVSGELHRITNDPGMSANNTILDVQLLWKIYTIINFSSFMVSCLNSDELALIYIISWGVTFFASIQRRETVLAISLTFHIGKTVLCHLVKHRFAFTNTFFSTKINLDMQATKK